MFSLLKSRPKQNPKKGTNKNSATASSARALLAGLESHGSTYPFPRKHSSLSVHGSLNLSKSSGKSTPLNTVKNSQTPANQPRDFYPLQEWNTDIEIGDTEDSFDLRRSVLLRAREFFSHHCGWVSLQKLSDLGMDDKQALSIVATLGNGSLGLVEEMQIMPEVLLANADGSLQLQEEINAEGISNITFVRKRVFLPFYRRNQLLQICRSEAEVIKDLVHTHIVHVFGSYETVPRTGVPTFNLLMFPVCEEDLSSFLHNFFESESYSNNLIRRSWLRGWFAYEWKKPWIQQWFSCLASALSYIHAQGVRHQDIKPSNIVHLQEHIFFTDFSSAAQFNPGATTSTENPARSSAMYCAPEMLQLDGSFAVERHGTQSDIFSLGCVFSEMLAVVSDVDISILHEQLNTQGGVRYAKGRNTIYVALDSALDDVTFNIWYTVIAPMLDPDRKKRPSASQVVDMLRTCEPWTSPCRCAPTYLMGYESNT